MSSTPSGSAYGDVFSPHHGNTVFEYVKTAPGISGFMLKGPTGTQSHAQTHCGAFAVPAIRQVSVQAQVLFDRAMKTSLYAQWYDLHPKRALVPGSLDLVAEFPPPTELQWLQIDWTGPAENHSHWRPVFTFEAYDEGTGEFIEPPDGTSVIFDCLYVPDNGLSVAGEPYLDGDQPGASWEGPRFLSTSIFGETSGEGDDGGFGSDPVNEVVTPDTIVLV